MNIIERLRPPLLLRSLRRRGRDLLLRASDQEDLATFREDLARRYLSGDGIEIGALHLPLRVPKRARVRYVDVMTREQLIAAYSIDVYDNPLWVVETDILDDGERLGTVADHTLDFVIANHMLEHTEDPIATLEHFVHTFDALRPRTTVEHLLRDHREGPEVSREEHYREWAVVECLPPDRIAARVAEFGRDGTRHHFHVWELPHFLEFLAAVALPLELELAQQHLHEFAVILRRG
jgi:hypothetical protein